MTKRSLEQNGRSFSELFTMKDEKSEEAGKYYYLNTDSEPRKDVIMTKTNMKSPQFDVEYNGNSYLLTLSISKEKPGRY